MSETPTGNATNDIANLYSKVRGIRDLLKKCIPANLIAIYAGYVTDIPIGWVLCDGNNGTPDLRGKFVYGATDDDDLDETGGTATHTHTIDHTHSYADFTAGGSYKTIPAPAHSGNSGSASTLPPYLKKSFIMFLGVDNLLKK